MISWKLKGESALCIILQSHMERSYCIFQFWTQQTIPFVLYCLFHMNLIYQSRVNVIAWLLQGNINLHCSCQTIWRYNILARHVFPSKWWPQLYGAFRLARRCDDNICANAQAPLATEG